MKFVRLAASLKESIAPVYLIEGEDAYFREHAVRAVREACRISMPELNEARVEGETLKGEALRAFLAGLNTLPFLDEKRLVRVYDYDPSEREWEDGVGKYAKNPCPTTVLLLVNATKKKADLKKKEGITFVDCGKETEETLSRWVFGLLRRRGVKIDGDAASLLVRYCSQDAARMSKEAEKLALLAGEEGHISRGDVEENVAKDTEYKVYELTQAASRGNFSAFSSILHDLSLKGFDEYAALAALVSHYRTLYEISAMRGTDAEVASALGVKPYSVQKNREAAARLGRKRVTELYLSLYSLSAGARSGAYTKTGAISSAIAKIFFG